MKAFVARRIPPKLQNIFLKASTRPRFESWKERHIINMIDGEQREKREKLFDAVAPEEPITYIEFGVHKGVSLFWWARNNPYPESRFHGFDSFMGLPENWIDSRQAGAFSTDGQVPQSDDSRISFHKGWFHETLPHFLRSADLGQRRVFHFDADLYRSTIYPLLLCGSYMMPGDIIIFDQFWDSANEFRAWKDFVIIFGCRYETIAATTGYSQVAFLIQ